ncbi:hypothetical protein OROGR_031582 [Orobanche gracilis]
MPKHYRPAGKKKEGNAAKYVTRSQAVKYLQVSLPVFRAPNEPSRADHCLNGSVIVRNLSLLDRHRRASLDRDRDRDRLVNWSIQARKSDELAREQARRKLCILKGVFPREPKKKVKGNHHSYYHMKDIMFLKHEPLLEKLRDIRVSEKKVKKAMAKNNRDLAERLLTRKPTYTLDMLVKYPKFIDALRDLDDCLSMVHLFAALPAVDRAVDGEKIHVNRVHHCRRLSHEWQAYISRTHKLRKTFISVKGIYYQAEVEGQKVIWFNSAFVASLQQVLPVVDYRVLLTFLEFFVNSSCIANFKLYQSINVKYPPIHDPRLEALAADLYALSRYFDAHAQSSSLKIKAIISSEQTDQLEGAKLDESELRLAQLQQQLPSNEPGALMHLVEDVANEDEDGNTGMVPRESLLFIIPSFGGTVSWEGEGAPFEESDHSITHQVVDRRTQEHKFLSREYVQPQWVFDCINARIILPTDKSVVGCVPPPHWSLFIDNEAEGHIPEYAEAIERLKNAEKKISYHCLRLQKLSVKQKQYHEELKLEVQGAQHSTLPSDIEGRKEAEDDRVQSLHQIVEDEANMSTLLVPHKKRNLLEAMKLGKKRKQAGIDLLKKWKKDIDEARKSV